MFKKQFLNLCFILIYTSFSLEASENRQVMSNFVQHSAQLKEIVTTIQKLPEIEKLMKTIQREGPIHIVANKNNPVCRQFGACWDPDERTICVDTTSQHSEGELIGALLFELQNALVNSKINYYDQLASRGQINKENYVRAIEYLEYENSIRASDLAKKGIDQGLFPASARLFTYKNFEEHYYYQKLGGHSAQIAQNYQQIAP